MKKTWKIGEYCKGGIITAEVTKTKVFIIGKDWDMSAGCKKSSNQSNAKEFTRLELDIAKLSHRDMYNRYMYNRDMDEFLNDLTTSYYASQVMDWVKEHLPK